MIGEPDSETKPMMAPMMDAKKIKEASSGPSQRSIKGSLGGEEFKGVKAQWTHEQEGLDFASSVRCCCCIKMGTAIPLILLFNYIMTLVNDFTMIGFLIANKASKGEIPNPLAAAYSIDEGGDNTFMDTFAWVVLAVFVIFLYCRVLTHQCLWPIAGPQIKAMCCKGPPPMVPLVKFRELATIAPKLLAINGIVQFMMVMVGGAVAQINLGTELTWVIV